MKIKRFELFGFELEQRYSEKGDLVNYDDYALLESEKEVWKNEALIRRDRDREHLEIIGEIDKKLNKQYRINAKLRIENAILKDQLNMRKKVGGW